MYEAPLCKGSMACRGTGATKTVVTAAVAGATTSNKQLKLLALYF
jgi:hypothetical protein